MLTSLYITDISGYYYDHYLKYRKNTFDSKDIKIDRTIAVRAYYDIKFLLYKCIVFLITIFSFILTI